MPQYGTAFANGGLFRVAYGMLGIGGPNSTFELNCSLPGGAARPTPPALRWPVEADANVNGCYWFVPRGSEQLSAIADHFGVDILDLIIDNAARGVFDWMDSQATRPDLSTPLTGKRLHVCGISKPLATVADLGAWPGTDGMLCSYVGGLHTAQHWLVPHQLLPPSHTLRSLPRGHAAVWRHGVCGVPKGHSQAQERSRQLPTLPAGHHNRRRLRFCLLAR